jgi:hypothetical protein
LGDSVGFDNHIHFWHVKVTVNLHDFDIQSNMVGGLKLSMLIAKSATSHTICVMSVIWPDENCPGNISRVRGHELVFEELYRDTLSSHHYVAMQSSIMTPPGGGPIVGCGGWYSFDFGDTIARIGTPETNPPILLDHGASNHCTFLPLIVSTCVVNITPVFLHLRNHIDFSSTLTVRCIIDDHQGGSTFSMSNMALRSRL